MIAIQLTLTIFEIELQKLEWFAELDKVNLCKLKGRSEASPKSIKCYSIIFYYYYYYYCY